MIWNRGRPEPVLKAAQTATREKRWDEAERQWRAYGKLVPNDFRGLAGLASVLIGQERWTDATKTGEELSRSFPQHSAGPSVLARVAGLTGQWHDAEQHWRDALSRNGDDRAALVGQLRALIRLERFTEAELMLEMLKSVWPKQPTFLLLAGELSEAHGDLKAAVAYGRQAAALFPGNREALRDLGQYLLKSGQVNEADHVAEQLSAVDPYAGIILQGQVLARRYPDSDHTDFWKSARSRHPGSTELVRRLLHAAIGAGREPDVVSALDDLLDHHNPRLSDANYVIGAINLLRGRESDIRQVLRRYLKRLGGRPEYPIALMRLSRQIFGHFCAARRSATPDRSFISRSRALLERCPLPDGPRRILERVHGLEQALSEGPNAVFFDTDVSAHRGRAFVALVRERLARKEAFSFLRLGDGEANCLPYEEALQSHAAVDAEEREEIWWGAPLPTEQRAALAARVLASIRRADCVGIPTIARFLRDLPLDRDETMTRTRSGRGLRAVLSAGEGGYLEDETTPVARTYTSAHLHQDLERWNLYGELFDGVGEIVCVTCHPDLPDVLQSLYGVRTAASVLIAPRSATAHLMRKRISDTRALPETVGEALEAMGSAPRDRLVLVGAGYLGKWIADEARLRGGVALDLGSMLDYWIGLKTRSYLDLA